MIDVTIPGLRLVSEANARGSWHGGASRAAQQRRTVALFFRSLRCEVPCNVRIVRVAPSRLDDDNLARAAKAVRDQLAEWLGVDDRDERVSWSVAQTKGGVREYAVRVIVRPWSPSEAGGRITRGAEIDDVAVVLTPEARESLTRGLMFAGARPVVVEVAGVRLTLTTATPRPVEASGTPAAGVVATSDRPDASTGAAGAPARRRNTRRRET